MKKRFLWIGGGLVVLLILGLLFFYFIVAPANTRIACDEYAREKASEMRGFEAQERTYDLFYRSCFRQKGFPSES